MSDCCGDSSKTKVRKDGSGKTGRVVIVILGGLTLLILGLGAFLISKTGSPTLGLSDNAQADVESGDYDWGDIGIGDGVVEHEFVIENKGTSPLKLTNVRTSCSCTTAQITIKGTSSPYFGMHTTSSWIGEVNPDEGATLSVVFDPAYHGPDALGPIERLVAVETNDSTQPVLEFKLTGNVVE